MIEFNRKILHQKYKSIVKTCITDGYSLPVLIKEAHVPPQYCYNREQKKGFFLHMDDETHKLVYGMIVQRNEELQKIRTGESKFTSTDEYYEYELKKFLEDYPIFKDIIKEENKI